MDKTMQVLELYCGIGGCAAAVAGMRGAADWSVAAAVDIDRVALRVYQANFDHLVITAEIESFDLSRMHADLWWLSPPCRPFTRRGAGRDVDDPRCQSFLSLLRSIDRLRPSAIALENVPPFAESEAARRLRQTLQAAGYEWAEQVLCPTQFGMPMRRRRFYLVARKGPISLPGVPVRPIVPLATLLDPPSAGAALALPQKWLTAYRQAIDVVSPEMPGATTACFTSAYGRSPVRSGSYLRLGGHVRLFSPREIARLMGFDASFRLPQDNPTAYRLLGNSLAIPVVQHVLGALEGHSPCCHSP